MSQSDEPVGGEKGFETSMTGGGGEVPMPSVAAGSRGQSGTPEDQDVAEEHVDDDRRRVVEGYVRPGEPHTD